MPIEHSPTRATMENPGPSSANGIINIEEVPQVNKIAFRAPPFWPSDPELWFVHLEDQFELSGITQDTTKFSHVLSQLDMRTSQEVRDVLVKPPSTNKYLALENALIKRLATSQEQRIRQLLEQEEIGDRKPSQFLRHLRSLAGNSTSEELLRTLWLGRLPVQMQAILVIRNQDPLDDVAEQADRIQESTSRSVSVAEVANSSNKQAQMEEQIRQLINEMAELRQSLHRRSRSRSREFSKNRNHSKNRRNYKQSNLCFYHQRFGEKAKKCVQPCQYQKSNEEDSH